MVDNGFNGSSVHIVETLSPEIALPLVFFSGGRLDGVDR
jgi:hypothetical protein